jgi:hypothetical protein
MERWFVMAEQPSENKPSMSMEEVARKLQELFSDPQLRYSACRRWQYDPHRHVFYRDPCLVEMEKILEKELGLEHDDEGDAPRPAA